VLGEIEVRSKWRLLFGKGEVTAQTLRDAQKLVDGLRHESPLRARLAAELQEIRKLHLVEKRRKK
jgi:hypothetical protein